MNDGNTGGFTSAHSSDISYLSSISGNDINNGLAVLGDGLSYIKNPYAQTASTWLDVGTTLYSAKFVANSRSELDVGVASICGLGLSLTLTGVSALPVFY